MRNTMGKFLRKRVRKCWCLWSCLVHTVARADGEGVWYRRWHVRFEGFQRSYKARRLLPRRALRHCNAKQVKLLSYLEITNHIESTPWH